MRMPDHPRHASKSIFHFALIRTANKAIRLNAVELWLPKNRAKAGEVQPSVETVSLFVQIFVSAEKTLRFGRGDDPVGLSGVRCRHMRADSMIHFGDGFNRCLHSSSGKTMLRNGSQRSVRRNEQEFLILKHPSTLDAQFIAAITHYLVE